MKNKVSVQTAPWFDENDPEKSLEFIKNCGFDAIDLSLKNLFVSTFCEENLTSCYDNISEVLKHYEPLKKASEKFDIDIFQAHSHFPVYFPENADKTDYLIDVANKMIVVCDYLNCRNLVVHPYYANNISNKEEYDDERQVNLKIYRALIKNAKKYNVTVCLENLLKINHYYYYDAFCANPFEACDFIDNLNKEAGEKVFGYCLDFGHANASHMDVCKMLLTLNDRVKCLHIHENSGINDAHMIPFTQKDFTGYKSTADWEKYMKCLKEIDYKGALNFETFLGIKSFPESVRTSALKLTSEIGKYFLTFFE